MPCKTVLMYDLIQNCCDTTNQKYYLGSDKSSVLTVWNFCSRSSEVTLRGKPVVARVMASYRERSK